MGFHVNYNSDGSVHSGGFVLQWNCHNPGPVVNCEEFGFCMLRGARRANWPEARDYCEAHDMVLPHPRNAHINSLYASAGTTWMNINVNDILNDFDEGFQNWRRRQRGWMTPNGRWANRPATDNLNFFCVEPDFTCDNYFSDYMFESGRWLRMTEDGEFERFNQEDAMAAENFEVGTVTNFRCAADWYRLTDHSFRCIRRAN